MEQLLKIERGPPVAHPDHLTRLKRLRSPTRKYLWGTFSVIQEKRGKEILLPPCMII